MKKPTQKTNRLFYKRWPYKIVCRLDVRPYVLRSYYKFNLLLDRDKRHEEDIAFISNTLYSIPKKDIQVRFEYYSFSIFCEDIKIFDYLKKTLENYIQKIYEPLNEQELKYMLEHGQKRRIVDKLPHEKFNYRIYIKPSMPNTQRKNFWTWMSKYTGKIEASRATGYWLTGERYYNQAPFIYIEDDSLLALVGLFLGDNIKYTEKFVLRSDINKTIQEQD